MKDEYEPVNVFYSLTLGSEGDWHAWDTNGRKQGNQSGDHHSDTRGRRRRQEQTGVSQDWWTSADWMGEVGNKGESQVMPG